MPGPTGGGGGSWRPALEDGSAQVGEVRIAAGTTSGWHSHGERTLFGFVVSGEIAIEHGPRGSHRAVVRQGEFVRIDVGVVHRDVNSSAEACVILVFNIGPGPPSAEAPSP